MQGGQHPVPVGTPRLSNICVVPTVMSDRISETKWLCLMLKRMGLCKRSEKGRHARVAAVPTLTFEQTSTDQNIPRIKY